MICVTVTGPSAAHTGTASLAVNSNTETCRRMWFFMQRPVANRLVGHGQYACL